MKNIPLITQKHRVCTVFTTPIYVSNLWLIVFFLFVLTFSQASVISEYIQYTEDMVPYQVGVPDLLQEETVVSTLSSGLFGLLLVSGVYLSVILHEIGHVYGAMRNSIPTHNITLWVLGGAANITQAPDTPRNSLVIVVFGPIVTLMLTCLSFIFAYFCSILQLHVGTTFFHFLFILNGGVLIFNLIPAFPLDGGRILRSVFNFKFDYYTSTLYTTRVAKLLSVGLTIVAFIIPNLYLVVAAGFIYFVAQSELRRVSEKVDPKTTDPTNVSISGKNFLFHVQPQDLQTPKPMELLHQYGGIIDQEIDHSTDYIIVPDGNSRKYANLAAHYNITPVTASTFDDLLMEVILDNPETTR